MNEIEDMIHRGTELCVKASNGTLTDTDREYIQTEIAHLKKEIDAIHDRTNFNEIPVLQGNHFEISTSGSAAVVGGLPSWVGLGSTQGHMEETHTNTHKYTYTYTDTTDPANPQQKTATVDIPMEHASATLDFSAFDGSQAKINELIGEGFHFTCCTCDNHYSVEFTNEATNSLVSSGNHYVYKVGIQGAADASTLLDRIVAATGSNPKNHYTFLEADKLNGKLIIYDDRSKETDTSDVIKKYNDTNSTTIPNDGSWGADWKYEQFNVKSGGNRGRFAPGVAYDPNDVQTTYNSSVAIQIGTEGGQHLGIELPHVSCETLKITGVDVSTIPGAQNGINAFKKATAYLNGERSRVGSYQNRLEHTIKNLDNVIENTTAAESMIRDTDMAKEMVKYSNENILAQAGQSMLAQANQMNQGVLALLQ